ncbi:MAG: DUF262 domain-containing protein, partial [Ktedonobacteraceae bacterium]
MKAQENSFLNLLTGKHQFVVPVYQRPYSWTLGPCIKLWEDVTRIASLQTQNTHFMGSILYSQIDPINEFGTVPQYEIVDGQQRTVTLSLLLAAIANTLNSFPLQTDFTTESIYSDYLINRYANGMQKYKMLLSSHDQDTFINLIEQPEQASSLNKKGNHLVENYVFFVDQIRTSNIDPTSLYKSLQKLIVIEISLSEEHDDLLRIFESINVTGLSLTQADLIRNDVFKGLNTKEQEQLYDSYWYPLEDTLSLKEKPDLFYKFMQDYLKQQLGQAPEIEDLYASFRAYHSSRLELPIKEIVEDMLDK